MKILLTHPGALWNDNYNMAFAKGGEKNLKNITQSKRSDVEAQTFVPLFWVSLNLHLEISSL